MEQLILETRTEESTRQLGFALGRLLEGGDIVTLWGGLGAGKTFLARAMARGLEVDPRIPVTSPTFTFINEYEGRLHLYHLDLYRLEDPDELETLPWREALYGDGVAVVEWPEKLGESLPGERLDVRIEITGPQSRRFILEAHGSKHEKRLRSWNLPFKK